MTGMPGDPLTDVVYVAATLLTALAVSVGALWYGGMQKRA